MLWYLAVFAASILVDSIPVFAPPAWTIMAVLMVWKDLDPYAVAAVGAVGSTIGRWVLSVYLPALSRKLLSRERNHNVAYLGSKLGGRFWPAFFFVLAYSLTPLSTTALFTAAGLAKVNPLPILPAFFIGKFVSDLVMVLSGSKAYRAALALLHGDFSIKTIVALSTGLLIIGAVMFIDWREFLRERRLRFMWTAESASRSRHGRRASPGARRSSWRARTRRTRRAARRYSRRART